MYKINRKTKYEIIKEIIINTDIEIISKFVNEIWEKDEIENSEERRKELLDYLEEMNNYWHEKNIDMTERQRVIIKKPLPEEELERKMRHATSRAEAIRERKKNVVHVATIITEEGHIVRKPDDYSDDYIYFLNRNGTLNKRPKNETIIQKIKRKIKQAR